MSNRSQQQSQQQLLDDRLKALGRVERRRLLLRLSATDSGGEPRIDFSVLGGEGGELDPLVAMRHLHLPALEERGFVRWDRENHVVTKGPRFDEIEPLLRPLREIQHELPGRWV